MVSQPQALAKVTAEMEYWQTLYQVPEYVKNNPEAYVASMVKALSTSAGGSIRRNWQECCNRVVFKTRFWPTLADLQAVADELTRNEGPNI